MRDVLNAPVRPCRGGGEGGPGSSAGPPRSPDPTPTQRLHMVFRRMLGVAGHIIKRAEGPRDCNREEMRLNGVPLTTTPSPALHKSAHKEGGRRHTAYRHYQATCIYNVLSYTFNSTKQVRKQRTKDKSKGVLHRAPFR